MYLRFGLRNALIALVSAVLLLLASHELALRATAADEGHNHHAHHIQFDVRSAKSGNWSDPSTWRPARLPKAGDRVLVSRGHRVSYDVKSPVVLRMVQVVGALSFARDRDTEMNVGVLKVQNSDSCSESGFACDFAEVNTAGEPTKARGGVLPTLEVGTLDQPIPAEFSAKIRLHYLEGMNKDDAPALVCCSARMDLHGAPMSRTWVKLGETVEPEATSITLSEPVTGWRVGDEVIVTGSKMTSHRGTYRNNPDSMGTESRRITKIEGQTLHFDRPFKLEHYGTGEFRSEAANISRNVVVESADPAGVRGHTMFHAYSQGGISYARFAHLGKEGTLGRYAIHFHLLGDSMRGSQVLGVSIVDSHNRWVTIHGTEYLVVRDCVGYQSIGHGYFMEDGTEVYNLLDRNLGIQSFSGKRLPKQVLPFDANEGAAFWWANGRNTLTNNVACENDQYGYRYDMQHSKYFSSTLPITMPDGNTKQVDVRTIGIWRFDNNESHSEGLAGMVVAANGNSQPDTPIRDQKMLDTINKIDWTGPDAQHPHVIRNLKIWEAHYAFRPQSPSMLMENIRIHRVAYGIYRPTLDNQEFRNLHLSNAGGEPFNRGMDDASAQAGQFSVDGLTIEDWRGGNQGHPVVHMSDNNLSGKASSHFRNVNWTPADGLRRAIFNRGGSVRVDPFLAQGVPYFVHDYYGSGRHAKIVSTKSLDLLRDGNTYRQEPPLTGDETVVAEVKDVKWPKLLSPVDELPPATIVTSIRRAGSTVIVTGVSHDNGDIVTVTVNGKPATIKSNKAGVADWTAETIPSADSSITAFATDAVGNVEQMAHHVRLE